MEREIKANCGISSDGNADPPKISITCINKVLIFVGRGWRTTSTPEAENKNPSCNHMKIIKKTLKQKSKK